MTQVQRTPGFYLKSHIPIDFLILKFKISKVFVILQNRVWVQS